MELKPIGEVGEGRIEVADDYWGVVESVIQLDESEFPLDSVQGLEEFSHLEVVWHFNLASRSDVEYHARSPRGNAQWPATGTFAHRNHRRPNQLAQSFSPVAQGRWTQAARRRSGRGGRYEDLRSGAVLRGVGAAGRGSRACVAW